MKSCNFNEDQLGKPWSLSLHFSTLGHPIHFNWFCSFQNFFFLAFNFFCFFSCSLFTFLACFWDFNGNNLNNFQSFLLHLFSSQYIWLESCHLQIFWIFSTALDLIISPFQSICYTSFSDFKISNSFSERQNIYFCVSFFLYCLCFTIYNVTSISNSLL